MTFTRFTLDRSTPSLWRVTFDHPPINLIDPVLIGELGELLADIERNEEPAVVVFDSADPDYFLAHYDVAADPGLVDSLPAGPTGFHPWVDILIRVSRLPAVTISAIRGRARGAAASSCSPPTSGSPAASAPCSVNSRSASVLFRRRPGVSAARSGRSGPDARDPARGRGLQLRPRRAIRIRQPRDSRR